MLKDTLKTQASALGFDDIGFARADDYTPFAEAMHEAYAEGRFGPLDYLVRTVSQRANIKDSFPEVKSVIIVVKNYYTGDHPPESEAKAKIARYAWGQDYHQWFKKRLKALAQTISAHEPAARIWPFNDTGPFLERAWAHKAGLGFIGKSAMFIHRGFGTWTLLGGLATDVDLEPDQAYVGPDCGTCNRCIEACPTKAIVRPGMLDANKCISTWTIERSLHPSAKDLAPRDHDWLFGCDICQEVCPWNKFEKKTAEARFQPVAGRVFMTEETFTQDLRGSALNRTRRTGLLVNYLRIRKTLERVNSKSS